MAAVLREQLFRFRVVAQVVVAVGQAESALAGISDVGAGMLQVRLGLEIEQHVVAAQLPVGNQLRHVRWRPQRHNRGEVVLQRRAAGLVDGGLVHRRGIEIADLLRGAAHVARMRGSIFKDAFEDCRVALADFVVQAPGAVFSRNRIGRQPTAVGVLEEIRAGRRARIEIARVDTVLVGVRLRTCHDQKQGRRQIARTEITHGNSHWDGPV